DNGDLLLVKLRSSRAYEYFELPSKSKKLIPILGQNEEERYEVSYSAHANEFIVLTTKFEDFSRLYKFKGGKFTPISKAENFEIDQFSMDPKKTKIVYH